MQLKIQHQCYIEQTTNNDSNTNKLRPQTVAITTHTIQKYHNYIVATTTN